jgi:hypothetical protein
MLWDDNNLYVLVAAEDPDIWSSMTERDVACLCKEETIELFIDPDGDGIDYAEIHINCLNTINDLLIPRKTFQYSDGSPANWEDVSAWTMRGMRHAVKNSGTVNDLSDVDLGTVFELALPWDGFGKVRGLASTPPNLGDVWRVNVNRYERPRKESSESGSRFRTAELSAWAPLELRTYHLPEKFGYVRFVDEP